MQLIWITRFGQCVQLFLLENPTELGDNSTMEFKEFVITVTDQKIDPVEVWLDDENTTEEEVLTFMETLPTVEVDFSPDLIVTIGDTPVLNYHKKE